MQAISRRPGSATRSSSSARRGSSSPPSPASGSARSSASSWSACWSARPGSARSRASMPWLNYVTISNPHAIEPFAELGIVLLLFSIGLELSFRRLWGDAPAGVRGRRGRAVRLRAASSAAASMLIGEGLAGRDRRSGSRWPCPRPRSCCRWSARTSPVGRAALAMLLFEDLALVPIVFLLGRDGAACAAGGVGSLLGTIADRRR